MKTRHHDYFYKLPSFRIIVLWWIFFINLNDATLSNHFLFPSTIIHIVQQTSQYNLQQLTTSQILIFFLLLFIDTMSKNRRISLKENSIFFFRRTSICVRFITITTKFLLRDTTRSNTELLVHNSFYHTERNVK